MTTLLEVIHRIHALPSSFDLLLESQLERHQLPKHDLLLTPDKVSNRMFFIEKGLIQGYYLKEDKDISTGFMGEGQFVISPISFFLQRPSFEYLELLEDSLLWSLTYQQLISLYETYPAFNYVGRIITEQYYINSEVRTHNLRMLTADERYQWFISTYKPVLNRLSNKHIASFLGLTPETVSRIRAKKQ